MKKRTALLALLLVLLLVLLPGCGSVSLPLQALKDRALPQTAAPAAAASSTMPAPAVAAPLAAAASPTQLEATLEQVYEQVSPSIVSIQVAQKQTSGNDLWPGFPFPWPEEPSPDQSPPEQYQFSSGSGFVWDQQGHIVTNNHVIDGADKIKVRFQDGTIVSGKTVGTDPDSDLAVIKVDLPAEQLRPVQLADSSQVKVGSLAIAIGQPFGLENTLTVGFISALGRSLPVGSQMGTGPTYTIPDVIQTDASINPGNSGGVLLNAEGQVIGVTTAIVSPVRASAGIGFAVPSAIVYKVVPVLITQGRYAHAWLGISGTTLNPDLAQAMELPAGQRGALVIEVIPDAAADKAGLQGSDRTITVDGEEQRAGGDVIVAIDGQLVKAFDDLVSYLVRSTEAGQKITLTVLRGGQEEQLEVTLGERPSQQPATNPIEERAEGDAAWLGVTGVTLSSEVARAAGLPANQEGILLQEIVSDGPADKAGLRGSFKPATVQGQRLLVGGDVITAWNGQPLATMEEMKALVSQAKVGDEVTLTILRGGKEMQVKVTLEARSAS